MSSTLLNRLTADCGASRQQAVSSSRQATGSRAMLCQGHQPSLGVAQGRQSAPGLDFKGCRPCLSQQQLLSRHWPEACSLHSLEPPCTVGPWYVSDVPPNRHPRKTPQYNSPHDNRHKGGASSNRHAARQPTKQQTPQPTPQPTPRPIEPQRTFWMKTLPMSLAMEAPGLSDTRPDLARLSGRCLVSSTMSATRRSCRESLVDCARA